MLWTYMGLDSEESGTDEARSVDSYGGDDRWQDWWYDNSPLSELYAFGSYDHYSKQEVVGTLVDLNNHLASCIGRSNDDHDFTDWMKHVSPLQVNLIAPNVMKRLRD
jgi:hypothetical protein